MEKIKRFLVSIMDQKGKVFDHPFVVRQFGEAERFFSDMINDPKTAVGRHPEDYSLHHVGYWSEFDGSVVGCSPTIIGSGLSYVKVKTTNISKLGDPQQS